MVPDPVKIAQQRMKTIGLTMWDEQKQMIPPMYEALQNEGVVFVGQGPTGMGKTYVIAAVTMALVEQGRRVCIALPSYTHLREVMGKHLQDMGIDYKMIRGLSALESHEGCPLKGGVLPTPIFCSDSRDAITGPESETCKTINCAVRMERAAAANANVVLTVFHKLLSKPSLLSNFDVVIFDESHGLEPTLRNSRIVKISSEQLDTLERILPAQKATVEKIRSVFQQLEQTQETDVPGRMVEREIVDPLRDILKEAWEHIRRSEGEKKERISEDVLNSLFSLRRIVDGLERQETFRFVYHQGLVLGIPNKIAFVPFASKKQTKRPSIALISATIENPKFHAIDSGFIHHSLAPPYQVESTRLIEKRYKNRPIFGLIDGPVLRKDPGQQETYEFARKEANKIIGSIVPELKRPLLILCRNGQDAKSIEAHLKEIREVAKRLYVFEDEGSALELDIVETKINQQIEAGKDIVVTTASSRVWEGVNLRHLRFLIVDALPYASPQPYERFEVSAWGSWRNSRTFRFMIRRVQQGIGRLMRTDDDPWGLVLVVDGRFNAQWNTIKSALPIYMTSPEITHFVTRDRLRQVIPDMVRKLETLERAAK